MKKCVLSLGLICAFFLLAVCCKEALAADAQSVVVEFVDSKWGGAIPDGMMCRRYGGKSAMSPALKVSNLPAGTVKVIVDFNDRDYQPLSKRGGHGSISVPATSSSVVVPSIKGETSSVPDGVTIEHKHRAKSKKIRRGAYLPPCSGGRGHIYEAVIRAMDADDEEISREVIVFAKY